MFRAGPLTAIVVLASGAFHTCVQADAGGFSVAVLEFEPLGVDSGTAQTVTEELRLSLEARSVASPTTQAVRTAVRKVAPAGGPCETIECLRTVGRDLGVDRLIAGKVGRAGDTWTVHVRVFDLAEDTIVVRERVSASTTHRLLDEVIPYVAALCVGDPRETTSPPGELPSGPGAPSGIIIVPRDPAPMQQPRFVTRVAGIELVPLPGGSFLMGSSPSESGSKPDERPQRLVFVSPFLISRYEVTQAQFAQFDPEHRSRFEGWNRPVENVTWYDAARFCNWLSVHEGLVPFYNDADLEDRRDVIGMNWNSQGYRLPTEAEWEYACEATCEEWWDSPYVPAAPPDGPVPGGFAWYEGNSGGSTHEVGQTVPTPCGLYDMLGNVREWVNDWHGEYSTLVAKDPRGPARGYARVARGGAWSDERRECRCGDRQDFNPGFANYGTVGFRIVRPWSPPRPRRPRLW